jgi:chemotaxis protein methyltransferase CheR
VDLNPAVLEKAARARYSTWALRETSADARRKWFRSEGREVILDETVLGDVVFEQQNLAADDPEFWRPGAYDVVFCRNVLMYFAPEQARAAIARIAHSLALGGYLFLGHAETLRGLSDDFHLRHTHGAFYYERKETIGQGLARPAQAAPRSIASVASLETFSDAWVDSIRQASERVEALVPAQRVAKHLALAAPKAWDLGPALDLVRRERFVEALAWVRDLPLQPDDDPDALLLEAVLLAHGGEFSAAEAVCRRLLLIDELNAGAHYALALCRESLGDRSGAAEHDRVAVYLDPAFAMPRLHLGLLARHAGDRAAARRELGEALVLLKREDASRLLLFGGGFNRDALIALCRSALGDCGGRP